MLVELLIIIGSVLIHELGHAVAMFWSKDKFLVKIKWYGVILEYIEPWNVKVNNYVFNLFAGVYTGFLFIAIMSFYVSFNINLVLMAYVVMLAMDITNLLTTYKFINKGNKLTLFELIEEDYIRWKKEKEKGCDS